MNNGCVAEELLSLGDLCQMVIVTNDQGQSAGIPSSLGAVLSINGTQSLLDSLQQKHSIEHSFSSVARKANHVSKVSKDGLTLNGLS